MEGAGTLPQAATKKNRTQVHTYLPSVNDNHPHLLDDRDAAISRKRDRIPPCSPKPSPPREEASSRVTPKTDRCGRSETTPPFSTLRNKIGGRIQWRRVWQWFRRPGRRRKLRSTPRLNDGPGDRALSDTYVDSGLSHGTRLGEEHADDVTAHLGNQDSDDERLNDEISPEDPLLGRRHAGTKEDFNRNINIEVATARGLEDNVKAASARIDTGSDYTLINARFHTWNPADVHGVTPEEQMVTLDGSPLRVRGKVRKRWNMGRQSNAGILRPNVRCITKFVESDFMIVEGVGDCNWDVILGVPDIINHRLLDTCPHVVAGAFRSSPPKSEKLSDAKMAVEQEKRREEERNHRQAKLAQKEKEQARKEQEQAGRK